MANRSQHVVPREDQWAVCGAGAKKNTEHFDPKQDAMERAQEIAQNQHSELVVHGHNGKIQYKDSHGHNPYLPKG